MTEVERVHQLLLNRVRFIKVKQEDGIIILEGRTATYYLKQIAQEEAMKVVQGRIINRIEVGP